MAVLRRRQPDLTILLDNVHKPHNFSAILRSADAVGVHEAHAVWPDPSMRVHRLTSGGAGKWLRLRTHRDLASAAEALHATGHRLVAAHPDADAVSYLEVDYTEPVAFVLGAELKGLSESALALADHHVVIPMAGHVESLNVSVAAALLLFEARRQREAAGMYADARLEADTFHRTLFEWAHPQIADYCQRHDRAYPAMDEDGEVIGNDWRASR